jgi:Na+-transporting NADH:ubiquinone oxidoreductase subunit F
MTSAIIAVLVVSAIGAALAAVLVVAERVVANYGECRIDINAGDREFVVQGGRSLLEVLVGEKLFIPSACGGRGTCGYCKVKVTEGGGPVLPTEEPFLADEEREGGVRLSCQLKVKENLKIRVPEELLSVQEYQCRCEEIRELTHNVRQFRLRLEEPAEMDFVPGQYVQLLTPVYEKSSEEVYRAYSISSDPADRGVIELIVKLVPGGICTTYLWEYLKEGDAVRINGPYGEFRLSGTAAPMICIAGGSGMAPIKCILHQMANEGIERKARFYFGANVVKDLYLVEEMKAFEEKLADFRFIPVVARPAEGEEWEGARGLVTEAVERDYEDTSGCEGYLCGPPGMIDASIEVLTGRGMPKDRVYFDKFT